MRIGAHVPMHNSKASQDKLGADIVQILLGSPQRWGETKPPKGEPAYPLYVHAPYLINLSTHNKDVLLKSRQTLWLQSLEASELDALGLVIHGGSWKKHSSRAKALAQWRATFGRPFHTRILIENSANGSHSFTRYLEDLEDLWAVVQQVDGNVGFCLDTCHLWSGGMGYADGGVDPREIVKSILGVVGRIDLVHANGCSEEYGAGKDRHHPITGSKAPPNWIRDVIMASGAKDVIAESSDPLADIQALRRMLS